MRPGTPADVDPIARWRTDDTTVDWTLRDAVRALNTFRTSDSRHADPERPLNIYVAAAVDAMPIGVVVIDAVFLQLVYVDPAHRGRQLGTRAASVVIDHFFTHGAAPWLGVVAPIPASCGRLLAGLGFIDLPAGLLLTREGWGQQRSRLADRY